MPKQTPKTYFSIKDYKRLMEHYKNDAENYLFLQQLMRTKDITHANINKINKLWGAMNRC